MFLVPGRQVPFLVRGGHGQPGPHGKIAYDNNIKKSQFVREMDGHNSYLMYYEPGTSQTPGYRLRIDAATLDTGRFLRTSEEHQLNHMVSTGHLPQYKPVSSSPNSL